LSISILHVDDAVVAVDKPSGMLVHRGWGEEGEVAMLIVRDLLKSWVYPVHRLDRGTSGVLLFARDPENARVLGAAFEAREVQKTYRALVRGTPPPTFDVDQPIPRTEGGPRVPAVTRARTLFTRDRYAWVEARPETGRLHQVRRHLKHATHPIIGDVNYGKGDHNRHWRGTFGLHRLALHASVLALAHPVTGQPLVLHAPVPSDLAGPLALWGLVDPDLDRA